MSEVHNVIRVFIASPGGLEDERKAVSDAIEEINRRNSGHWKIQFKPVGWEDTIGGNRRPQSLINRDLETCDYFVGILADHWGSPPQATGSTESIYTSGFHEEYELAQKLSASGSMEDIFLFFRELPSERIRDAGPSLKRVLDFREKVKEERKPFYFEFSDIETFSRKVGDTLSAVGWRTVDTATAETEQSATSQKLPAHDTNSASTSPDSPKDEFIISGGARIFLENLLEREGKKFDALSAVEVARLRLIAMSEHRSGNDVIRMGVHDANILYKDRRNLNLTDGEKYTLISTGLKYMPNKNTPLWGWMDGDPLRAKATIQSWMGFSEGEEQLSAIKLATILGYEILDHNVAGFREALLRGWYDEAATHELVKVATKYLICHADAQDTAILGKIKAEKSGQKATDIDIAIIAIALRKSLSDGLSTLIRIDPESIHPDLLVMITSRFSGVSSEDIVGFTRLKSESLRLVSIKELRRRKALTVGMAEELTADSSIDVRFEALITLAEGGIAVPEARVQASLTKRSTGRPMGLFGFARASSDTTRMEAYQRHLLMMKPLDELQALEAKATPLDTKAFMAACKSHPRQMRELLKNTIADGFKRRFDSKLDALQKAGELSETIYKETLELKEICCAKDTETGLSNLASYMRSDDLQSIRDALDASTFTATDALADFLGKFGDWSDVSRILKLKVPASNGGTLLSIGIGGEQQIAAIGRNLYSIGRDRFIDLLEAVSDAHIKSEIILAASRKCFTELPDDTLLNLMNDASETLRNVTCLRCIELYPKRRIIALLDRYIEQDAYRYYSTVHWLDLGISMPKGIITKVVESEILALTRR